jgi:hypothetical protein
MSRVSGSNADRGGHISWDGFPHSIRGDEGEGADCIVLGTEVSRVGFKLFESRLELDSRVIGEGVREVEGLVGWLDGWMDGRLLDLDC